MCVWKKSPHSNASVLPSGENAGRVSKPRRLVNGRIVIRSDTSPGLVIATAAITNRGTTSQAYRHEKRSRTRLPVLPSDAAATAGAGGDCVGWEGAAGACTTNTGTYVPFGSSMRI